jgi:hypothetical protein
LSIRFETNLLHIETCMNVTNFDRWWVTTG